MAKKPIESLKSFTLKGDYIDVAVHALECCATISELMMNDKDLSPDERGQAAFTLSDCRDLLNKLMPEGGGK